MEAGRSLHQRQVVDPCDSSNTFDRRNESMEQGPEAALPIGQTCFGTTSAYGTAAPLASTRISSASWARNQPSSTSSFSRRLKRST
jgi:hypothetical protein